MKNLYQRPALIESIAVAAALAQTADNEAEYLHWDARRAELEAQAGEITAEEMTRLEQIAQAKMDTYNGEACR